MRCKLISLLSLSLLYSCVEKEKFTKTNSGMEYRLVQRDAGGIAVHTGQYLKLAVVQRYGDTVLRDPSQTGYEYQLIDSAQLSKEAWTLFHDACAGDSLVFRVSSDSAFKNKKPAFVKKKDWLITSVKVVSILENADSVYADRERNRKIF